MEISEFSGGTLEEVDILAREDQANDVERVEVDILVILILT